MALPNEESICYPHAWVGVGRCPHCLKKSREQAQAYQARWEAMSLEERVEELKRRVEALEPEVA